MASMTEGHIDKEIRLVMVGKTGCGKSSLGNSLLAMHNPKKFESKASSNSITQRCQKGQKVINGNELLVIIDTPGLFDSTQPNDKTLEEIVKCFSLTAPGPHVFLFVMTVRRLSEEEVQTIEILKKTFGDEVMNYVIVVFTGKDELDDDDITIENFVSTSPDYLKRLISDCQRRYVAICNKPRTEGHSESVNDVMELILSTIRANGDRYYTDAMFQKAEAFIKKEEEKRRAEKEAEEKRKHEEHLATLKTKEEKVKAEEMHNMFLMSMMSAQNQMVLRQQILNEVEIGKLKDENMRREIEKNKSRCTIS